jgi:hypothetical protein
VDFFFFPFLQISKSRQFFRSWRLAFAARQLIEARGQLLRRTISDRLIAAAFTRIRSEFCARKWQAGQLQGSQSTAPPKNRGDNVSMTLLRQQSTLREFQWPSARATMLSDDE